MARELEFERPIRDLEQRIDALTEPGATDPALQSQVDALRGRAQALEREIFERLTRWQRVQLARHPERPYTLDYLEQAFEGFMELHGDRAGHDDAAIVTAIIGLVSGVTMAYVAWHGGTLAWKIYLSGQVSAFEIMWREYLDVAVATNRLRRPFAADYPVYVLTDMHCGQPETDARRFETMLEQAIESGWVLDAAVAQSMADAEALWAIRDGIAEVLRERAPTLNFDVSVPVGRIGECVARMRANLERGWPQLQALFFGHVGDGNVHVVVCKVPQDADSLHSIEEAVYGVMRDYGGSVSAEHGIGVLKRDWLAYSRTPAELALMRTLKTALDPRGILNPGKML